MFDFCRGIGNHVPMNKMKNVAKNTAKFVNDITAAGWVSLLAVVALVATVSLYMVGNGPLYLIALVVTVGAALVAGDMVLNHLKANGRIAD